MDSELAQTSSENGPADSRSQLGFKLAGENFALDMDLVVEVVQSRKIARLPHSNSKSIKGVANVRGRVLPVLNLTKMLELDSLELNEQHCLVVVKLEANTLNEKLIAFQAEEVTQVEKEVDLPDEHVLVVSDIALEESKAKEVESYEEIDLAKLLANL